MRNTVMADLGIQPSRLKTVSYGEEQPADTKHSESAWAKKQARTLSDSIARIMARRPALQRFPRLPTAGLTFDGILKALLIRAYFLIRKTCRMRAAKG